MKRKIAVMTGATGGIGRIVAQLYAARAYQMVFIGRNREKLAALQDELQGDHTIKVADLSLVKENKRVAKEIREEVTESFGQIDLLLNLAGIVSKERRETEEGHELTMATNLFGPIALSRTLMAQRTVVSGSGAINFVNDLFPSDLRSVHEYKPFTGAYARSKAFLTLWAFTGEASIGVCVADPGATKTDMTADEAIPLPFRALRPLIMQAPEVAAKAFIKAGIELSEKATAQKIILPKLEKEPPKRFLDRESGAELDRVLDLMLQR